MTAMTARHGRAAIQVLLFLYAAVGVVGDIETTCKLTPRPPRIAAEIRLRKCLLQVYNEYVRPTPTDGAVKINFQMKHIHIMDMNTKTGVLRAIAWLEKSWIDPQLTWEPSDYESINTIHLPAKQIWTPDIVQYHNIADQGMLTTEVLAVVSNYGNVTWAVHGLLSTLCYTHMKDFPFDLQECLFVFGSWTYDHSQLEMKLKSTGNPNVTYQGGSWHITTTAAHEYYVETEEGGDPFSNVAYAVTMIRMSAFYRETLMLPAVILVILTMCMFFVPLATGERLVFGVGLLLASVFLLLNVEQAVRSDTGEIPKVVKYLAFDQVMLTAGIILSMVVYNCHHRNVKRSGVPTCLKTVFLGRLSRLLCVPAEPYTRLPRGDDADVDMSPFPYDSEPTTDATSAAGKDRVLEATLQDIRKYLRICATHATSGGDSDSHHQVVLNEWMQLARVVDRLLFAIFVIITVMFLLIIR